MFICIHVLRYYSLGFFTLRIFSFTNFLAGRIPGKDSTDPVPRVSHLTAKMRDLGNEVVLSLGLDHLTAPIASLGTSFISTPIK